MLTLGRTLANSVLGGAVLSCCASQGQKQVCVYCRLCAAMQVVIRHKLVRLQRALWGGQTD